MKIRRRPSIPGYYWRSVNGRKPTLLYMTKTGVWMFASSSLKAEVGVDGEKWLYRVQYESGRALDAYDPVVEPEPEPEPEYPDVAEGDIADAFGDGWDHPQVIGGAQ